MTDQSPIRELAALLQGLGFGIAIGLSYVSHPTAAAALGLCCFGAGLLLDPRRGLWAPGWSR